MKVLWISPVMRISETDVKGARKPDLEALKRGKKVGEVTPMIELHQKVETISGRGTVIATAGDQVKVKYETGIASWEYRYDVRAAKGGEQWACQDNTTTKPR